MPDRGRHAEPIAAAEFERLMGEFNVQPAERVAVAVSGGADSLALTVLLADWLAARNATMVALTVDHGLRADSAGEALQVASWLADAGVEHHILHWLDGSAGMVGMQAQARDARYGLMADWCRAHKVRQLFVAHHLGDQAETFVMRLKRASTLFGLAAMAAKREWGGVWLCRPLLAVPKARLIATLNLRAQAWVEDPSNLNQAFERVRTRALIEALRGEGVTPERLAGAARAAGRITEILDRAVLAFETAHIRPNTGGGLDLSASPFAALPLVLRERVLTRALQGVGGQIYPSPPAKVARLAGRMSVFEGGTLGGSVVTCRGTFFSILPEPPRKGGEKARKVGNFTRAPLPRTVKHLTSQTLGGV